ncbi:MAG: iron ABC transporter permease, partial [Alphaproteobacteria bacterium]|nr:iron ABC transporter permease [Alphaproteobacteria bacterium]
MADASMTLPAPRRVGLLARWETTPFHLICAGTVAAFLVAFLIVPVATVVFVAFWDGQSLTLVHFADFF